jgi:hypothetical protein
VALNHFTVPVAMLFAPVEEKPSHGFALRADHRYSPTMGRHGKQV